MSTSTGALPAPFPQYDDPRLALAWDAGARHINDLDWHAYDEVIAAMEDASGLSGRDISPMVEDALRAGWLVRQAVAGMRCLRVTARGLIECAALRPTAAVTA